jgi:RNA polymerase sigma-70 factor, ECF subfamily
LGRAVNQQLAPADHIEDGLMRGPLEAVPAQSDDALATEAPMDGAVGDADVVALVDRAREGDPDAFASLYDRYVERVYRFVLYRVHGDNAMAEDITSEVFLRALRKIKGFTWQGRDVGAWFLTIARNLVLDHFKSGRARLEVLGIENPTSAGADHLLDAEDAALSRVSQQDLYKAIQQLGSEQQEVIYWRFLQGYSVAETAAAMGKTDGAIKALQYRAVKALYKLVVVGEDV